jgi:hypothetical protein
MNLTMFLLHMNRGHAIQLSVANNHIHTSFGKCLHLTESYMWPLSVIGRLLSDKQHMHIQGKNYCLPSL